MNGKTRAGSQSVSKMQGLVTMFHPDFGGDAKRILKALGRSLAIIEFEPNGKIITANEKFCRALGYELAEIKGKHHSMFVDPDYARSPDYREFWAKLGRGEFDAREYKRIGKGGKEVWIQASYNPVVSKSGNRCSRWSRSPRTSPPPNCRPPRTPAKLDAISRAQAIIEFSAEGKILTANENFLKSVGLCPGENPGPASSHVRRSGLCSVRPNTRNSGGN